MVEFMFECREKGCYWPRIGAQVHERYEIEKLRSVCVWLYVSIMFGRIYVYYCISFMIFCYI